MGSNVTFWWAYVADGLMLVECRCLREHYDTVIDPAKWLASTDLGPVSSGISDFGNKFLQKNTSACPG